MKYLNKKTSYIIIVILAFLIILFLFLNRQVLEAPLDKVDIPDIPDENYVLSNRDIAIKEVLEDPDKIARRTQINGDVYLFTGYDDTFYGGNAKENKPGWEFGGLIVFKLENGKPVFFWESKEIINIGRVGGFRDINSDGISEIVWEYDLGVTGRNNCFYVYKFVGDGFELITPAKAIEGITPSGTTLRYNRTLLCGLNEFTNMRDIDNDGVPEIIVGHEKINSNKKFEIYKYDGEKYYLWKSGKVGEDAIQPQFWDQFDSTYIKQFIEE